MDPCFVHSQFPTSYVRTRLGGVLQVEHAIQDDIESASGAQKQFPQVEHAIQDDIESASGDAKQCPQVEHAIKDAIECPVVDHRGQPGAGFPDTRTKSPPNTFLPSGEDWFNELNNPREYFQLWIDSLPAPLPPGPFTPGPIAGSSGQETVFPEDLGINQQPPYTYLDGPLATPNETCQLDDEPVAMFEQTPVKAEELSDQPMLVTSSDEELAIPFALMGVEVKSEDGMSMNTPLKEINRSPSTSNIDRSISSYSLTLKPLQFNTTTSSWPLPPIQSATRSFWDPIRDALREQVRIEKMEDTNDWIKELPNDTEMLAPEVMDRNYH
ncbi:hypothetical protein FQN49_000112 [Arthroderma sp. PD_2]|nr:hypothetical protein FQN49_000112 [Arthroderma sp. PD_2]